MLLSLGDVGKSITFSLFSIVCQKKEGSNPCSLPEAKAVIRELSYKVLPIQNHLMAMSEISPLKFLQRNLTCLQLCSY